MSNQVPQHNYFLMIPAFVADDKDLDDATKMLFGRLAALSNREGYSWASDEYLAEICNCKDRVIRDRLTALEEKGYIRRETKKNGMSWDRKIYPIFNIKENLTKGMGVPDRKAQACRIERHVRAVDIDNDEIYNNVVVVRAHARGFDISQIYRKAISLKKDWTTPEIDEACKILTEQDSDSISDHFAYVEGIIIKNRNKTYTQNKKFKEKSCQKSQQNSEKKEHSMKRSDTDNESIAGKDTKGSPYPKWRYQ